MYYKIYNSHFSFYCLLFILCVSFITGKTYFFKGKTYWEFNDSLMHVTHSRPELSAPRWMRGECPRPTMHLNEVFDEETKEPLISGGCQSSRSENIELLFTLCAIIYTCLCNKFH